VVEIFTFLYNLYTKVEKNTLGNNYHKTLSFELVSHLDDICDDFISEIKRELKIKRAKGEKISDEDQF